MSNLFLPLLLFSVSQMFIKCFQPRERDESSDHPPLTAVPGLGTTPTLPRPLHAFASPWVCSRLGRSWGTQREADQPQGWWGLFQHPGDAQQECSSSLRATGLPQPTRWLPQDKEPTWQSRTGGRKKTMVQKQDTPGPPSR